MTGCPTDIEDLVLLSQAGSSAPMLVQGPGGNASIKSSDQRHLYIKASGYRLSEVSADAAYVTVDLKRAVAVLESAELAALSPDAAHRIAAARIADAVASSNGLRASLETPFHTMFDRCVLHTHAVYANAFACMENGHSELERILGEPACSVAYRTPGYALAQAVRDSVLAHLASHGRVPDTVLLENHGLITSGPDVATAVSTTAKVVAAGRRYFGDLPPEAANSPDGDAAIGWAADLAASYLRRTGKPAVTKAVTTGVLRRAVRDPLTRLLNGNLGPDEAVFFQGSIRLCGPAVSARDWLDYFDPIVPARLVAAIADQAVVLLASNARTLQTLEENLTAHALVVELISRVSKPRTLLPEDSDRLVSMQDEQYRQTLASAERT